MTHIAIRPMTAEDLTAAATIIDRTGLFPGELLAEMAAPALSGEAADEAWFVAAGPTLLGLAYVAPERMTDGTWNLLLIAVDPDAQGLGVGKALTRRAEAYAAAQGGRVLLVETSGLPAFERTRTVYGRLGYAAVARIPEYYAAGEAKVVFWKAVAAVEPPTT